MLFICLVILFVTTIVSSEKSNFNCSDWRKKLDDEGNAVFIAGDRSFRVPITIEEIELLYCRRQYDSLDNIKLIGKNCMKAFPRQMVCNGLLYFESKSHMMLISPGWASYLWITQGSQIFVPRSKRRQAENAGQQYLFPKKRQPQSPSFGNGLSHPLL
jgi:hypothetical protein